MGGSSEVLAGRWAVVTGASSGIGAAIARALARRRANLVLVARRKERLETLAAELRARDGVEALVEPRDLLDPEAREGLAAGLRAAGIPVDVLVNDAGFGAFGPYAELDWERERAMIELDVVALAHLTKLFLPDMLARRKGWILQVSSVAAYQPAPLYAAYAAAKAYVRFLGEAVAEELRGTGVTMTVLAPGATESEFLDVAGQRARSVFQRLTMMSADAVAEAGVRGMLAGRRTVVPGLPNRLAAAMVGLLPSRAQTALARLALTLGARP